MNIYKNNIRIQLLQTIIEMKKFLKINRCQIYNKCKFIKIIIRIIDLISYNITNKKFLNNLP